VRCAAGNPAEAGLHNMAAMHINPAAARIAERTSEYYRSKPSA